MIDQSAASGFQNRREFFRLKFNTPVEFKSYSPKTDKKPAFTPVQGTTQNVSQSGILFQTGMNPPQLSSILWMNVDLRTLKICQEIESRAIVFQSGVLGRVVRVEEDPKDGSYDIGVCFLTQEQRDSREVREILTELESAK